MRFTQLTLRRIIIGLLTLMWCVLGYLLNTAYHMASLYYRISGSLMNIPIVTLAFCSVGLVVALAVMTVTIAKTIRRV